MTIRHLLVPSYLLLCVLLGGASAAGQLSNLLLQLAALPIIVTALLSRSQTPAPPPARALIALTAAMVGLLILQLVPLPPALWQLLPGRDSVAEGYRMLGQDLPWLPVSLMPDDTLAALLWVLPAIGIVLAIIRLGAFKGAYVAWALSAAAVLSVLVGAMQVAEGRDSAWYFYSVTNFGVAVGFFANTNHLATLLLMVIPFQFALQAERLSKGGSLRHASGTIVMTSAILVLIVVGLLLSTSIAGLGLVIPVLAASVLILGKPRPSRTRWVIAGMAVAGTAAISLMLWSPISSTLAPTSFSASSGSRQEYISTTLDAARHHLPLGTGIGSFREVYRMFEDPMAVDPTYVNHAHSDYVELALETGIPGLVLAALFLFWWFRRAVEIWRSQQPNFYAQAAVIASAAALLHSLVDYPLRTAAIAALFATCSGLMTEARSPLRRRRSTSGEDAARHLSAD